MQLNGKTALVTGASSGMGLEIAKYLAEAGMNMALAARRTNVLSDVANTIRDLDCEVLAESVDVSNREASFKFVQSVIERFGTIDLLVNNAGINTSPRSTAEIKLEDWDHVIQVNLTGAFNFARAVIPHMRSAHGGLIINIASIAAVKPSSMAGSAYSASKAAMRSLTATINDEEWQNGIRATSIHPGETDTPILRLRSEVPTPEELARMVQPEDIAATVAFVAQLPPRAKIDELVITPTHHRI